jgi:hypothetical protein
MFQRHQFAWQHDTQHDEIQHNDTQHKGLICDTQHNDCRWAECRYAECRGAIGIISKYLKTSLVRHLDNPSRTGVIKVFTIVTYNKLVRFFTLGLHQAIMIFLGKAMSSPFELHLGRFNQTAAKEFYYDMV